MSEGSSGNEQSYKKEIDREDNLVRRAQKLKAKQMGSDSDEEFFDTKRRENKNKRKQSPMKTKVSPKKTSKSADKEKKKSPKKDKEEKVPSPL